MSMFIGIQPIINWSYNAKNNFYEIFTACQPQIGPKIKNVQNLLKSGTFDISNIPISILMSKIIPIKYLTPVRAQIGPKVKSAQNLLKFGAFNISNMLISILTSKMILIKYLPPGVDPNWS